MIIFLLLLLLLIIIAVIIIIIIINIINIINNNITIFTHIIIFILFRKIWFRLTELQGD